MTRLVIHVGVHKTATTNLQNRFELNREVLEQAGVIYPSIFELRKHFTYLPDTNDFKGNAFIDQLIEARRAGKTVLVSDENLIGSVADTIHYPRPYYNAGHKIALHSERLDCKNPDVFLCIRDYATYAVSLYCEYLRHHPYLSFEIFYQSFVATQFSWVQLVEDILRSVPECRLHVWSFSNYREVVGRVITEMTGLPDTALPKTSNNTRDSFSAITMTCIEKLSTVLDFRSLHKAADALAATFPRNETNAKYDPLPTSEALFQKSRFLDDLKAISAMGGRVHVIG